MPKTLLEIVQAVQGELGLPVATFAISNPDATTLQIVSLANRCIDELRREHPVGWDACQFEYNIVVDPATETTGDVTENSAIITNVVGASAFTPNLWVVSGDNIPQSARVIDVVVSTSTVTMSMEYTGTTTAGVDLVFAKDTFAVPDDYDWTQNQTHWDRTNHWELLGPDSPQASQWQQSGIVTTGPRRRFRSIGPSNLWRIWPPPFDTTSPIQLVFEYLSLNAVVDNITTPSDPDYKQYFTIDTDVPLLDDQALITGIKWMFFEIKGFNVINMQNRWVDYVQKLIARDGAAPTLSLARTPRSLLLTPDSVADGFWPGPTGPNMS